MYKGYIYKITNTINGKSYIGQTTNLQKRQYQHKNGYSTKIMEKAFIKYGVENFDFEELIRVSSRDLNHLRVMLNTLEKFYIKKYNTYKKGYNATIGGEGTNGYKMSPEALENNRKAHLGCKLTKEQKKKIGDALRGRTREPEMIARGAIKRRKPVLQYSIDGEFIKEYEGISFIENHDGASISMCCSGKLNQAYGYIWRYKTSEDFPRKIEVNCKFHLKNRPVTQYTKRGEYMRNYNNIKEASEITNISISCIKNCTGGLSKSAGGFMWKYKEEGGTL